MPAFEQRMSIRSLSSRVASAIAFTDSWSLTSTSMLVAPPPVDASSLAASAARRVSMSATTTWAPSLARTDAIPRPIPLAPPVTMATRPCKPFMSGHVNLDVVGDAAEDRVVGPGRLQDRAGDELRDGPMRHEARDEALPGDATAEIAVEPEAPVRRAEDLTRPDRVRLRRHPRPVPSEGVECVLHDRHRVQLDEARTCLLVRLEIADELLAQV